jgi:hypothetical protein
MMVRLWAVEIRRHFAIRPGTYSLKMASFGAR